MALLEASAQVELFDIETGIEAYRAGIATWEVPWNGPFHLPGETPGHTSGDAVITAEEMISAVRRSWEDAHAAGTIPVVIGGEHSVTIGAVQAAAAAYRDVSVLQLDAHADLRETYEGSRYNHACVMARVHELCPATAVGIRSMDASEAAGAETSSTFYAHDLVGREPAGWCPGVVETLTEDVYITIDLDVFDPSIMPSTGTPEPGGLGWYDVLRLLRLVARERRVVGFDVVELCPGPVYAADFLAAKLVYKLMGYIIESHTMASDTSN